MGHGDAVGRIIVRILRLPKVKTDPNIEPVRALPEGPCFDKFLTVDLDERDGHSKCSVSSSVRPLSRLVRTEQTPSDMKTPSV
jgi:hypothetical protein